MIIEKEIINGIIVHNIFPDYSSEERLLKLAENVSEALTKILSRKNS